MYLNIYKMKHYTIATFDDEQKWQVIAKSASHSIEECRIKILDGVKWNENFNFPSNKVDLSNIKDNNVL